MLRTLLAATLIALARSCGDPSKGIPVLGGEVDGVMYGIDFVALSTYTSSSPWTSVWANGTFVDKSLGGYNFFFQSAANLKEFQANPTKYAPAVGGY